MRPLGFRVIGVPVFPITQRIVWSNSGRQGDCSGNQLSGDAKEDEPQWSLYAEYTDLQGRHWSETGQQNSHWCQHRQAFEHEHELVGVSVVDANVHSKLHREDSRLRWWLTQEGTKDEPIDWLGVPTVAIRDEYFAGEESGASQRIAVGHHRSVRNCLRSGH